VEGAFNTKNIEGRFDFACCAILNASSYEKKSF